jgi:secernin
MCDTFCYVTEEGTFFAKNSDRPVNEAQLVKAYKTRQKSEILQTQYLKIKDEGAFATVLSQPEWLWGAEHGVNDKKVAVGNEKIYTVDDPYQHKEALIGMDLVRLVLERASSAQEGVEILGELLEKYGQGGIADIYTNEPYWSSFLISDPFEAYVVETSHNKWAAKKFTDKAAISNRITLKEFDLASKDLKGISCFDDLRNKDAPTQHADVRLSANQKFLEEISKRPNVTIYDFIEQLRDHNGKNPPPKLVTPFGEGITVCMHVKDFQLTQASMVCYLPKAPHLNPKAFFALANPCSSIFLPAMVPKFVPRVLSERETWRTFYTISRLTEQNDQAYYEVTSRLNALEATLISQSIEIGDNEEKWEEFISYVDYAITRYLEDIKSYSELDLNR